MLRVDVDGGRLCGDRAGEKNVDLMLGEDLMNEYQSTAYVDKLARTSMYAQHVSRGGDRFIEHFDTKTNEKEH